MKGLILPVLMLFVVSSYAQTSHIKQDFRNADPVSAKDSLSPEAKAKVYKAYLDRAIHDKDITKQFYGHLFLYNGYYNQLHDYKAAAAQLMQADSLAIISGLPAWSATVELRKGAMAEIQNNDYERSLAHYREAVAYSIQADDSLCIGESLEQVSSMFTMLGKSDSAHFYFALAMPLLRTHADAKQMELIYFNYSLILAGEHQLDEAIRYTDSAIAMSRILRDPYREMGDQTAKASFYTEKGELDKAIKMYNELILISKANNWTDRLEKNYLGLMQAYEKKGDYHAAYDNLTAYYSYKDSIINGQVQLTIATLSTRSDALQKQLALDRANELLAVWITSLIILVVIVLMALIVVYLQSQRKKSEIALHQDNLQKLTQLLAEKNALLAKAQASVPVPIEATPVSETNDSSPPSVELSATDSSSLKETEDFENSLYNQRILTYEDWFLFKAQFEKAYPGYLPRLKKAYPSLSEAEERMFLLIKLKLKSKEISAILGITTDAVKKTRVRLKKRIDMGGNVDLDVFIAQF